MRSFSIRSSSWSSPSTGEHVREHRGVVGHVVRARVLRQVAGGRGPLDDTGARSGGATEDPQQRGLPGAVAPDQPDLLPRMDVQSQAVDDRLATDLDDEVTNREHARLPPPTVRAGTFGSKWGATSR